MADFSSTLPVTDKSDGAAGSVVPSLVSQVGGSDGTNLRALSTDTTGKLNTIIPDSSVTGTLGALNTTVSLSTSGRSEVHGVISGTWVGSIQIQGTGDGSTWESVPIQTTLLTGYYSTPSITANTSIKIVLTSGYQQIRAIMSGYTSGTATVVLNASTAVSTVEAISFQYGNLKALTQLTDNTNIVGVTAASTAANTSQAGLVVSLSPNTPLPPGTSTIGSVTTANVANNYQPNSFDVVTSVDSELIVDASGRLETHGSVTSDEGSFRDDFSGTSLTTALTGTVTFTNGSSTITGTGTLFTTQLSSTLYVKKTSDSETLYLQVSYVISETQAVLVANYAGTTATTTAVSSKWQTITGTGGSETVASSIVTIGSGTTASTQTWITTNGDYLPYTLRIYASISQRITNQGAYIGFVDNPVSAGKQAWVQFTGTTNTQVNFITSSSSAATDTQTTLVTLPNGGNTSTYHLYQIDLSANQATLSIDGVVVAINTTHLPGPYDVLNIANGFVNLTTAPASSTSLNIDYCYFSNWDRIQIDNDFNGEPLIIQGNIASNIADIEIGRAHV